MKFRTVYGILPVLIFYPDIKDAHWTAKQNGPFIRIREFKGDEGVARHEMTTFIDSTEDPDDPYVDESGYNEWIDRLGVEPIASTASGDADGYEVYVRVLEPLPPEAEVYRSSVIDGIGVDKDSHFDMMMDEFGEWP